MNGSQHYREGGRLLSDASFQTFSGRPIKRNGEEFEPGEHCALVDRAMAHFAAAQVAATALAAVLPLVGGDHSEVTHWAYAVGVLDEPAEPDDVVEAVIYPEHWPPSVGDLWVGPTGHRWLARRGDDGMLMVSCWQSGPWGEGPPDFCSPDELLKAVESLTLLNREEPPF